MFPLLIHLRNLINFITCRGFSFVGGVKEVEVSKFCGSGHILIPFIIGVGAGLDTKILLQTFLVGMRDHFGDAERGTSM